MIAGDRWTFCVKVSLLWVTVLALMLESYVGRFVFLSTASLSFFYLRNVRNVVVTVFPTAGASTTAILALALFVVAVVSLPSWSEQMVFLSIMLMICVFLPLLKWWMQQYKTIISGPWDIAHVSVINTSTG